MVDVAWKKRLDDIRLDSLPTMFGVEKPIIGMVHLWPLPGAPGYSGYGMNTILAQAQQDAEALLEGGVDGLIVENMWDLPFYVGTDVQMEAVTAQAVAAAVADGFDLVLTDLRMPGIDGMEVLARIRNLNESILVIVITGYATVETAVEAMKTPTTVVAAARSAPLTVTLSVP